MSSIDQCSLLLNSMYPSPAGTGYDFPFIHVYDGSALADGGNAINTAHVPLDNECDFVLRRIAGLTNVAAKIQLKEPGGTTIYSSDNPIAAGRNYTISPDKLYKAGSRINFDLYTILRTFSSCNGTPIYRSFLALQGVERYTYGQLPYQDPFPYKLIPYTFSFSLSINQYYWSDNAQTIIAGTIPLSQPILDYTFELYKIIVHNSDGSRVSADPFAMTLYSESKRATSNIPVLLSYLNAIPANTLTTADPTRLYANCFPIPPLVYRPGSSIRFDIQSRICNGASLPQTFVMDFIGSIRVPVLKGK